VWTIVLDGITSFSYTARAGDTLGSVAGGLVALVNAPGTGYTATPALGGTQTVSLDVTGTDAQLDARLTTALTTLYDLSDIWVTHTRTNLNVTFTITFTGAHAGADYPPLQWFQNDASHLVATPGQSVSVKPAIVQHGTTAPSRTTVQTLTVDATGGTYVLH